jgi:hypothetical protein
MKMTEEITEITVAPIKLNKAQKAFFGEFAHNAVADILGPVLEFKGVEITRDQLQEVVATLDLSGLTTAIGQGFLAQVDFKTILKVDKFMKSEEFNSVLTASSLVNAAVQGELVQIVAPLIPSDEPDADALADLAS